jgi:membrane-associated phospholipid phosphatase
MPVALLREVDAHTVAMLSSWVGRSAALDRTVAALAEHLAKLDIVLLGLLVLGPDATVRRRHRITALRIGVVLPLTIAAVGAIGRLVGRQRPFASAEAGPPLVDHAAGRSFPSRQGAPRIGWAMAILGVLLAASRIYAGLHYPTDVMSGWAIGVGLGLLVRPGGVADGDRL